MFEGKTDRIPLVLPMREYGYVLSAIFLHPDIGYDDDDEEIDALFIILTN